MIFSKDNNRSGFIPSKFALKSRGMWAIAAAFSIFLLADLSSAQNPYTIKRPSYCSTCFTNDQRQNYYCCFYFFRCCAESRLGSNNRKITTPRPDYPVLLTTPETLNSDSEHTFPTEEKPLAFPGESESKTEEFAWSGPARPSGVEDGLLSSTSRNDASSSVHVPKPSSGNMSPDSSEPHNENRFRNRGSERTSAPSAYGGRRYPYNVRRMNAERPTNQSQDGGLHGSGGSETRYNSEVSQKDDVVWGRMEPV